MIFECMVCRRRKQLSADSDEITHGLCSYCYVLDERYNGGVDWRKWTPEMREEFKINLAQQMDRFENLQGEPQVKWPEDAKKFVDDLVQEIKREKEGKDGSRR